jgi:hypothetical protein
MTDKITDNLITHQNLGKKFAYYLEKNEGINLKNLYQSVIDNVKNLNDKQTESFEKEIDSFLQPVSSGGKRRTKRKSRRTKRKSRRTKRKSRRTKRKSRKYWWGGEEEDEMCLICQREITKPEIQNSIEINELPNNNGVLPRETVIHHTCVAGTSNDIPIKRVYYHGGCLADWFRSRYAQHQCLSCNGNLTNAETSAIIEAFPPEGGIERDTGYRIGNVVEGDDENDVLVIQLNLAIREYDEYHDNIFGRNRRASVEEMRELIRRGRVVLALGNLLRQRHLNGFRRYLFLFIRACHMGTFINPQEEAFILDNLSRMNETQSFISLMLCFFMTIVIWYYFSMWIANQVTGGNGKDEIINEKEPLDLLIKLLNKLIEYNKGGNTAEIEKFLGFVKKNIDIK